MLVNIDGNILKILREEKNVSQEELAEVLQCKRQTISNIEIGKTKKTSEQNLYTLAKYFDIAPDRLRGLEDTPQETALFEDRQVLADFVSRLHSGNLRETDFDVLLSIARFFGVYEDEAKNILEKQNCALKIYDRKKTVLEPPIKRGDYRSQISCKFNQLSDSKLPSLGRLLDYIITCDIDRLYQLEELCKLVNSYEPPNAPGYRSTNEYIYYLITEYETPRFWRNAKEELSKYSFKKSPEELKELQQVIDNDLGNLRYQTVLNLRALIKKWNSKKGTHTNI